MAKFMFVYRSGGEPRDMSPEEMQQAVQVWDEWIENGKNAGWLIDGGDGLQPEGAVIRPDLTVTDGPFAESKELVAGYSLVEAETLEAAVAHAKTSPMLAGGGSVEVREFAYYT